MAAADSNGYCRYMNGLVMCEELTVTLRCVLDGLLLPAELICNPSVLIVYDGLEAFAMEAIEALYYEVVEGTAEEMLYLQVPRFRLLRRAADFEEC
jgi:hypothetical protein